MSCVTSLTANDLHVSTLSPFCSFELPYAVTHKAKDSNTTILVQSVAGRYYRFNQSGSTLCPQSSVAIDHCRRDV